MTNVDDNLHVLDISSLILRLHMATWFLNTIIVINILICLYLQMIPQGLQQVSDTLFDTHLTINTSVGSNECLSVSKGSPQASISISRLTSNNALNL